MESVKQLKWIDPNEELPKNEEEYVLVRIKDEGLCLEDSPYAIARYLCEYEDDPNIWPWFLEDGYQCKTKMIWKRAHIPSVE